MLIGRNYLVKSLVRPLQVLRVEGKEIYNWVGNSVLLSALGYTLAKLLN